MVHAAHVVVCHLEYEKWPFEDVLRQANNSLVSTRKHSHALTEIHFLFLLAAIELKELVNTWKLSTT